MASILNQLTGRRKKKIPPRPTLEPWRAHTKTHFETRRALGATCGLAREYDPDTKLYNGSFLDDDVVLGQYQGIYCFNVLQLFLKADRMRFVRKSAQLLSPQGLMFFTGISDQDASFGQGEEVEENTFAVQPDKILHFFTLEDLKIHFEAFKILEVGNLEDQVSHALYGLKRYQIRYILACV